MLISEVIDKVKGYCNGTGPDGTPIDPVKTRDQVLWGTTDRTCTGIVCCIWATADVIREAAARGANLIISHEALFWNHGDHTDWLIAQQNKAFLAKRALLEETGITVWRCHDYIHSGIPAPDGSAEWVDGIFWPLAQRLGWKLAGPAEPLANQAIFLRAEVDERPAKQLAHEVVAALGSHGLRIIGDPETPVRKVGLAMHLYGFMDNVAISTMDSEDIDCLLAMETNDYTLLQYVRDSSQEGMPKCVLSCGHFNIEDPGMEYMPTWLPAALGEDAPKASYVAAGDPFTYVIA